MEYLRTFVLGLVQGLTEFLPVSSSGHLAVSSLLLENMGMGADSLEPPLLLDILLHLGTLVAIVIYFRRDVGQALVGGGRALAALPKGRLGEVLRGDEGAGLCLAVLLGTLPTGVLGLALKSSAAEIGLSPLRLGVSFLACALILAASRFVSRRNEPLGPRIALLVGFVQGIAVLPGISRSGATIAAATALGLSPERAARFSFLLSLPAILGATILEVDLAEITTQGLGPAYLLGALTAFVSGLFALKLLVMIVDRGKLWAFAPYVAAVGLATMVFL
jgi:undecaprenyl-diphosphatase